MGSVALLPKKFKRPNKWFGSHLPSCDICPLKHIRWYKMRIKIVSFLRGNTVKMKDAIERNLIDHERKITVTVDPLSKHMINNCFTSRSNLPKPQEGKRSNPYSDHTVEI